MTVLNDLNKISRVKAVNYPFNLLTEYFICENNIDTTKEYEVVNLPARQLIKHNRFDLMAKWIYIDAQQKGLDSDFGRNIYYDNINAFSCGLFFEPGTAEKNSFNRYVDDLNALILDIKNNGFNASKSLVPVGMDDELIDGSHRVSVAAYFDCGISVVKFPQLQRTYNYEYFRKYMMSDVSMGYMAMQYAYLKRNCYMACLWPKADLSKTDEVEECLRSIGNIVYSQDVYLTYQGMRNFMTQIYGHQSWTGSIDNHFIGACAKVDACYKEGQPVRTYLFEADSFDEVVEIKKKIRDIFKIENHSIHISDDENEAKNMAEMLYNRNSVDFMNRADPYQYSNVYKKTAELKKLINSKGHDMSRFIIDSSAILEVCGLRQAADVDYLTDYIFDIDGEIEGVDNHAGQLQYYTISLPDMLYNPENYFYFEGMKFITPQRLIEMKTKRGEEKDIRDVELLNNYLNKKIDIPKEYRFETIDKIRKYQLDNRIYGQGQWTYEWYKTYVRDKRVSQVKNTIKAPIRFSYHWITDKNFRIRRKREQWINSQRNRLKNNDITIISSNCNGGVISSDLGLEFKSPFVNLFIKSSDYIRILSDLKGYMSEELRFVQETDPIYGDVNYPTAYLKDAKIYFMHYSTEDEARDAWNRRKARINWDNLYVIFTDRSGCTMDDLRAFDKLPYEHKVVFTHIPQPEIKSAYYIKGYEDEEKVGLLSDWQDESKPVKRVYDQFDFVGWFNGNQK